MISCPTGKPDGPHQRQFLLGIIIARDDQLLLPVLQFHPGAKRVDGRAEAGILLVHRLVIQRLRVL